MQGANRGIPEDRRDFTDKVQRQPQRRALQLHTGPPAARRAKLVDDGVLHELRRVG